MRYFPRWWRGPSSPEAQAAPPPRIQFGGWGGCSGLRPSWHPTAYFFNFLWALQHCTKNSKKQLTHTSFFFIKAFNPSPKMVYIENKWENQTAYWNLICLLRGPVGPKASATPFLHEICGATRSQGRWGLQCRQFALVRGVNSVFHVFELVVHCCLTTKWRCEKESFCSVLCCACSF